MKQLNEQIVVTIQGHGFFFLSIHEFQMDTISGGKLAIYLTLMLHVNKNLNLKNAVKAYFGDCRWLHCTSTSILKARLHVRISRD